MILERQYFCIRRIKIVIRFLLIYRISIRTTIQYCLLFPMYPNSAFVQSLQPFVINWALWITGPFVLSWTLCGITAWLYVHNRTIFLWLDPLYLTGHIVGFLGPLYLYNWTPVGLLDFLYPTRSPVGLLGHLYLNEPFVGLLFHLYLTGPGLDCIATLQRMVCIWEFNN